MKNLSVSRKVGLVLAILLGAFLAFSASMKLTGSEEVTTMFALNNLDGWHTIIGIGELVSVLLFVFNKTLGLGTVLLSAYFGGAIMFHMSSPIPEMKDFTLTAILLVLVWIIAFLRGLKLVG